jgi:hypothetical protein
LNRSERCVENAVLLEQTMATEQKTTRREVSDEERAAQLDTILNAGPLPMIQRSIDAFRRDLPELLKTHYHKWVAYHGDERIGFGRTETDLYEECFRRGLTRDEFVVCGIDPGAFDPDEEIEVSRDV